MMELDMTIKKELENINLFNHEIKSTSDRACAIVCAALLDDMLQKILLSFLCKDSNTQDNKLFSQNGPLSTFSSKITLSYRLGLISKSEHDNLNLIRKIRNSFAHDLSINSFECNNCKELLAQHIPNEELLPPLDIPITYSNNGVAETPSTKEFIDLVFDKDKYNEILPKFPVPSYPILDRCSMRSVFVCIVLILQSSLNSRRMKAIIECRQAVENFNDILDVEQFKIDLLENKYEELLKGLDILKRETILRLEDVEKKLSSNYDEKLYNIKTKLNEQLIEIDELIQKSHIPKTLEYALLVHTSKCLGYNRGK